MITDRIGLHSVLLLLRMITKLFDKNLASVLVEKRSLLKPIRTEEIAVFMIGFIYTMEYEKQPIRIQEGSYIVDGIDRPIVRCKCSAMIVLITVFSPQWYKIVLQRFFFFFFFFVAYQPLMLCSRILAWVLVRSVHKRPRVNISHYDSCKLV